MHFPDKQVLGDEHSSFSPHLHCPAVQVSVLPAHVSFDPQKQTLDVHVSDALEQSSLVVHSGVIMTCHLFIYHLYLTGKNWLLYRIRLTFDAAAFLSGGKVCSTTSIGTNKISVTCALFIPITATLPRTTGI